MSTERSNTLADAPRRYRSYPEYKDSGVEWLGEIPAGWEVKRLKRVASFRGGGTPAKENLAYWVGGIPWVSPKDMKVAVVEETEDRITDEAVRESATRLIPAGAVLIVVRSGILAHSIPVAIAGREVTLNQDLKAVIPGTELQGRYLMYLVAGMQREFLMAWKKEGATVESLELDLITSTPTPLPSLEEQRAIAAFLDRETARIDALVTKKERLIELLQEQRTALTTRAVTKGLDPNVPMKDSGVEWLGEIPAHWEVKRLKNIVPAITVGIVVTPAKYYVYEGVPCLRSLNITRGHVDMEHMVFISAAANELHRKSKIYEGDVLVVRTGRAGAAVVVPRKLDGANCIDLLIVRRSSALDSRFLYYFINSPATSGQVEVSSVGAIQEHYNTGTLAQLLVTAMPRNEQCMIAAFLDRETVRIDAMVAKIRDAVARLKELRIALISAAVTGKIDVREETA